MAESAGFSECLPPREAVFDGGPFSWPYLVFFNSHSAVLATGDTTVLDAFAHNAVAFHVRTIGITGHVDAAETGPADRDLDRRRADSVRIYLAKSGIVSGVIFFRLAGDREPRVGDAKGVPEPQNRFARVDALGGYDGSAGQRHRQLLCRRWALDHCVGGAPLAPASQCRTAIDFLAGGDSAHGDFLDWETKYLP